MWYVFADMSHKLTEPVIAEEIHRFHIPVSSQVMFAPLLTHQALSCLSYLVTRGDKSSSALSGGEGGGLPNPAFSGRAGTVNQAD